MGQEDKCYLSRAWACQHRMQDRDVHGGLSSRCLQHYWKSSALLLALQVMHILWFYMFLRILMKLLFPDAGATAHDAGREVYEGGSDDEGDSPAKKKR